MIREKGVCMIWIGRIGIFLLLILFSVEDIRHKAIVRWHFLLAIPWCVADLIMNTIMDSKISLLERGFGLLVGSIFLLLSHLTRGQLGMGDAYVILILCTILGIYQGMEVITYSFLLSAIIALILVTFFRYQKKRTIPFVPFLFGGFIISIFLGGTGV